MDYSELVARLRDRAGAMEYDGWVETAIDYNKAAQAIEELCTKANRLDNIYCIEFNAKVGLTGIDYVAYFDIRNISAEEVIEQIEGLGDMIRHPQIAVIQKDVAQNVFGYQGGIAI